MSLEFDMVRGKNLPEIKEKMGEWVREHDVQDVLSMTVHRDVKNHTVYSMLYREGGE